MTEVLNKGLQDTLNSVENEQLRNQRTNIPNNLRLRKILKQEYDDQLTRQKSGMGMSQFDSSFTL